MLNVRKSAKAAGLAALCHLALACSSDGDGANAGGALITGAREGIYRLDASTVNEAGCDAEGPDELEGMQITHVYMINKMGGTRPYVQLAFCISTEHCRMVQRLDMDPSYSLDGYEFFESSTGQFVDAVVTGAETVAGQCVGGTLIRHELSMTGDSFRIETRRSMPPSFPDDPNSRCFSVSTREDIETGTCQEYEVLRGTFAEPL